MVLGEFLLVGLEGLLDVGKELVLLLFFGLFIFLVFFFLLLGVLLVVLLFGLFLWLFLLFLLLLDCCWAVKFTINRFEPLLMFLFSEALLV